MAMMMKHLLWRQVCQFAGQQKGQQFFFNKKGNNFFYWQQKGQQFFLTLKRATIDGLNRQEPAAFIRR